jgi:hypothetical protein
MTALANLLIAPVLFFALGAGAQAFRSDLKFPPDLVKALSIYLLVAIGLHGGAELAHADLGIAARSVLAALALGTGLPLLCFVVLTRLGRIDGLNAAAIAAHYGSVSAATFLTAVAWLQSRDIAFENYPLIMLAVMESPAIIVGLLLAQGVRRPADGKSSGSGMGRTLLNALTHGSIVLLLGSMVIGAVISPASMQAVEPFFRNIFMGALCLYLLELGMVAAQRLGEFRKVGGFLVGFGLLMPLVGGALGLAIGHYGLGFGAGGSTLVAVLGASASYIAVPPAVRMAIPEANPSLYLTLSLGITFPFNVVLGIPLYYSLAQRMAA